LVHGSSRTGFSLLVLIFSGSASNQQAEERAWQLDFKQASG
jgi:hypothetical protein